MKVFNSVIIGENKGTSQTIVLNPSTSEKEVGEVELIIFDYDIPEERISLEGIPSTIEFNIEGRVLKVNLDAKGDAGGGGSTELKNLWYSGISLDSSSNSTILCAFFDLNPDDDKFYLSVLMVGPFTS